MVRRRCSDASGLRLPRGPSGHHACEGISRADQDVCSRRTSSGLSREPVAQLQIPAELPGYEANRTPVALEKTTYLTSKFSRARYRLAKVHGVSVRGRLGG